jgi:hypothetical protein
LAAAMPAAVVATAAAVIGKSLRLSEKRAHLLRQAGLFLFINSDVA